MNLDRIVQGLKEFVRAQFPNYDYQCLWEYRVAKVTQGPPVILDVQATPATAKKMPDLVGVTMWPGPSGCVCTPKLGASVRVGFVNADPTKPYVAGVDPASHPDVAMLPADVEIDLGANPVDFVALASRVAQLQKQLAAATEAKAAAAA